MKVVYKGSLHGVKYTIFLSKGEYVVFIHKPGDPYDYNATILPRSESSLSAAINAAKAYIGRKKTSSALESINPLSNNAAGMLGFVAVVSLGAAAYFAYQESQDKKKLIAAGLAGG